MSSLILTAFITLTTLSLAGVCGGQGSRCDFLNFNPEHISIRSFGHSESYVFTQLPLSSCNDVNLNFINFCFHLAGPSASMTTEQISEIVFLSPQGAGFHVDGVFPLLAETSYCDGETVQFQSWSLCCISRRIADYSNISLSITLNGELNHNFALTAPSMEGVSSYVAVGFVDFRINGYVTNMRLEPGGSLSMQPNTRPFLPVLSFSQDPVSYRKMSCPTQTPCTMSANSTMSQSNRDTTTTTDTSLTDRAEPASTSGKDAAIGILICLLVASTIISGILGIFLFKVIRKPNNTGKAKKNTEKEIVTKLAPNVPPIFLNDYNHLSHSPPAAAAGSTPDDFNVLDMNEKYQKYEALESSILSTSSKNIYSNGPAQLTESKHAYSSYRPYDYPQHCCQQPPQEAEMKDSVAAGHDKSMSMKSNAMYGRTTFLASIND